MAVSHLSQMLTLLIFAFLLRSPLFSATRPPQSRRKFQTSKLMQRLNKSPLKTIQSSDGDTIDCIPISQQPAMDHPFLKDHQIMMSPEVHPDGLEEAEDSSGAAVLQQTWQKSGQCPKNSIPVRRTKEEDVMRASSVKRYGKKKRRKATGSPFENQLDTVSQSGHKHAIAYVEGGKYYGVKAAINVWNPTIQQENQFSLSQIWVLSGSFGSDLNSIEAGWQVNPQFYGDNRTRLFVYWTDDAYKSTGCYNLLCSGFVQVSNEIAVGASISPISNYAKNQYDIKIMIWKDPKLGDWWMRFDDRFVGYWPSLLFSYLGESASIVELGGEVARGGGALGGGGPTQMGSGHYAEEGFGKASYIRNIQLVDQYNSLVDPGPLSTYTEAEDCYNVRIGKGSNSWGSYFYFGGPGTGSKCT